MSLEIGQADLARDGDQIAKVVTDYLNPCADRRRFEWLYTGNPNGEAKVWLARDVDNKLVATAAAFPRRIYVGGNRYPAWVLGDFWVENSHRSLGPALQLQKRCLADLKTTGAALCYDFPNRNMLAIYRRLGLTASVEMIRFAKLLRVDRQVGRFIKSEILVRAVSAPLNKVLSVYGQKSFRSRELSFLLHEGMCREDFSRLAENIGSSLGACIDRSSEYLNWRYRMSPLYPYEIITAYRADVLVGYCVFYQSGQDGTIVDLFGYKEDAIVAGLIGAVENLLRARGVAVLSVPAAERHPFVPLLHTLGFAPRERTPVVSIISEPSLNLAGLNDKNWLLMAGDRDS
jgi:hypothetical protein